MSDKNIYKDIEVLKEFIKKDYEPWSFYEKQGDELFELQEAIENVLSELEKQKNFVEHLGWNGERLQDLLNKSEKELETYKKIAEKLADKLEQYGFPLIPIRTSENELGLKEPTKQELLDWARKEVEKNDN